MRVSTHGSTGTSSLLKCRRLAGASDVIHVNSFDIKYREDGSEEQFFSNLSVLDGTTGAEVCAQP